MPKITKAKTTTAIKKALKKENLDFGFALGFFLLLLELGGFGILINLAKF